MVQLISVLALASSAQALWLATVNMDYGSNAGGSIRMSPYCQVGKGNTRDEALSKASSTVHATAIIAGGHCDQLPYRKTNQLGGFWDDHGDINYIDGNRHWYCKTGSGSRGACDAGDGAPRK
ncbi:hypothetical protein VHEMI04551 [[Torrubiella] hemipterigena]|uniref:Uncharacterized protein n=1 Tax=[Torrubiella] hemipterigena TaxID=1531966 RepID=A0A0A1TES2_9HYPO|nr:hypothetical protein VHEMI04551 [[Torrubiella] hemipterigena]